MLQLLHIENIAVIERADISFRAGFNALTGETGAGKSIVIDSLGAVLGARTSRDLIRTGAAKAFVSAEFDGVDASLPVLAALGVEPEDGVLLLQRDIYADGKNICRANGRPITVAQLRALGTSLLNIHGQHEGTQLLDEEQHGAYLDRFARLDGLPEAYTERYQAARETRRQIEALQMDEAEKARQASKALFSGAGDTEHMPTTELTNDDFGGGAIDVLTLLVKCGLAASKGEARRLVQQGGILVGDDKVTDLYLSFDKSAFENGLIVKKGKKTYHKFTVK